MEPRKVEGLREYALDLAVPAADVLQAAGALAQRFEASGACIVGSADDTWTLSMRPANGRDDWTIQIRTKTAADTGHVLLRAQPAHLHGNNFWPPPAITDVVARFVISPGCAIGGAQASATAHVLTPERAEAWLKVVLFSPTRTVPIVVVTPGTYSDRERVDALARELAGLALVYVFDDEDALRVLRNAVSKERGVFGGAVRLYRPGFTPEADPLDHDLLVRHYLELRLIGDRTLGAEIARRILPLAGDAIPLAGRPASRQISPVSVAPAPVVRMAPPTSRAARTVTVEPAPARADIVVELDGLKDAVANLRRRISSVESENEGLAEENRRLTSGLAQLRSRADDLEAALERVNPRLTHLDGLPWPIDNPERRQVTLNDSFRDDVAAIEGDGSLAAEARKKIEAVLADPERYGKPMRAVRKGQYSCHVARNYRLVWAVDGEAVRFIQLVSKEDIRYSPHGA